MPAPSRDHRSTALVVIGTAMLGVVGAVVLATLIDAAPGGSSSRSIAVTSPIPTPATSVPPGSPVAIPTTSPPAPPDPTPEPTPVASLDPVVARTIRTAIAALGDLRAYRAMTYIAGRSPTDLMTPADIEQVLRGEVVQRPAFAVDVVAGTALIEAGGNASTSFTSRTIVVGERMWVERDEGRFELLPDPDEPLAFLGDLLPPGFARHHLDPFAGGFERVGEVDRDGIAAVHYRLTDVGRELYAATTGVEGTWTGDLWIAADGGYLTGARIIAERRREDQGPDVHIELSVTDVDARDIEVTAPD